MKPVIKSSIVTEAEESLNPTTAVVVLKAEENPVEINFIEVMGIESTSPGILNLYVCDNEQHMLWQQFPIMTVKNSKVGPSFVGNLSTAENPNVMPLTLPVGYSLCATSTTEQGGIRVLAQGRELD
jgi:hypothetical protein